MTTVLIIAIIGLFSYIIKALIDFNGLVLQLKKDKEVNAKPNDLESNYQFIKGLY
jgi:hypothetical protein